VDHYKGDVGTDRAGLRAASTPGSARPGRLLVGAYRAGLALFRDGE
jgi:hypothetical protein